MGNAILRRSRRVCALCNAFGEHDYEATDYFEGTCKQEAWEDFTCSRCNDFKTEWYGTNSDNHEDVTTNVFAGNESTCVTRGKESTWCRACNGWIEDNELDLDPTNHEGPIGYSGDGSSSTCVTHGDREVHCDACGDCWGEELPLDPNNHEEWVDGGLGVEGHCEACGAVCEHEFYTDSEGYVRCSKCGYFDY